ncbi:MAG: hypothetical protein ACI4KM_04060 [Oscillospiraceae bacterium]
MDKYTSMALSFIESSSVRKMLSENGTAFSPQNAAAIVFNSSRPQQERFEALFDILADIDTPQSRSLSELLQGLNEITCPKGNPHYIFREKYAGNPREFLTAAQVKRFLAKHTDSYLILDVYSRGKIVCEELYLCSSGVYDLRCPAEVKRLVEAFTLPQLEFFKPGEVVRNISDGSLWVVIDADFTKTPSTACEWEIIDFSAMVVPYEYRDYATPELIHRHFTERSAGGADIISVQHEHICLPLLERVNQS